MTEQATFNFENPDKSQDSGTGPESVLLDGLNLERPLVFFDLETTGLDQDIDRIVQFAFLKVNPDRTQEEWQELVNPRIPIPAESSAVHKITDETVKDKPDFAHFAPLVKAYLEDCDLSGFNIIRFDVPFLQKELDRHGEALDLEKIRVVDAQTIFHKMEPRTLSAAYRYYCGGEHEDAHDAMGDVRVTLDVFNAQLYKYTELPKDMSKLGSFCNLNDDRWVTPDRRFYWRHGEPVIAFGKHKGKTLLWLSNNETHYLNWMINGEFSDETKEMVKQALQGVIPKKSTEDSNDS